MDKMEGTSFDMNKLNIDRLKDLFPNVVTEGKINFEMLRNILGDEVDDSREKYQFTWKGKSKAIKLAQLPSSSTLRPCKEKSKSWDETENFYIEGDNLEVLKQLQKTYYGKIKMIYIDPPYNTGNDFVYNDSFIDNLTNYKEQTSQHFSSNPETNGRFHSDWLNMIYPRLLLAKNLLKEDGVIMISIDDNEVHNLVKIGKEIFGDNNTEVLIWNKEAEGSSGTLKQTSTVRRVHEYVVCLYKNIKLVQFNKVHEALKGRENEFQTANLAVNIESEKKEHPNYFTITNPNGDQFTRQWKWAKKEIKSLIDEDLIYWGSDGHKQPRLIIPTDERRTTFLLSILNYGGTTVGRKDFEQTMEQEGLFSYPKPIILLKKLIETSTNDDDIIMDFFAGSSTTAHAIMELNAINKTKKQFILVQLPEKVSENDKYENICDIGEERIKLAGEQIKDKQFNGGINIDQFTVDFGFKVFKLDSTNINEWDNNIELDEQNIFINLNDVFKSNRTKEDVLYEIMLKYGIFDQQVTKLNINNKIMYRVGRNYMLVCLEDEITNDDINKIANENPRCVVFKEAGFKDDNDKINAVYNLEKAGVEDIKCI